MTNDNRQLQQAQDAFRDVIVKTTTNESNLAGHYPYSPERWRLFKGSAGSGNRLYPEYDTVVEYNHAGDYHEIMPAGGETIIFESAERYRYVVQYELEATWAIAINQELNTGDYIRCGLYDGSDGWFLEHNGSHGAKEIDIVLLRNGSEQYRNMETVGKGGFQTNTRFGLETAWYDVTRQQWTQSFSDDGTQRNLTIGTASADDVRGPEKGNLNLRFEVHADSGTSGLTLEAGSAALVTKGSGKDNFRTKAKYFLDTVDDSDTWTPVRAFRERDAYSVVNNQLLNMNILSYTQDTPVEAAIFAFDETNVTFGTDGWSTPDAWMRENNAIETRSDVNNIVDSTGSSVATATDPGGIQVGYATLAPTTGAQFQKGVSEAQLGAKRNLPDGDIGVLMVHVGNTGDIGYATTWEQDW